MYKFLLILFLINLSDAVLFNNVDPNVIPNVELFPPLPLVIPDSNNEQCKEDSLLFLKNIVNSTTWAYQMWDSSARQPNGQLFSVGYNLGHYQECLAVREPFKTQYCLVFVEAHTTPTKDSGTDPFYRDPFDIVTNALHHRGFKTIFHRDQPKLGLCVPASCDYQEFEEYLNSYLAQKVNEGSLNISYTVRIPTGGCQTNRDDERLEPSGVAFMYMVACLIFMVLICSLIDWRQQRAISTNNSGSFSWLVTAFSLRNTHAALVSNNNEHSELRSLHGLRFCGVLITVFGHVASFNFSGPVNLAETTEKLLASFWGRALNNLHLFVDTFLVLSGILLMYSFLRQREKRPINPVLIIFLRYVRLTPMYGLMLWYYCSVFYSTGEGPLWKIIIEKSVDHCKRNWWLNLLYIHTEVRTSSLCLVHTWYLSCDTQLFIVGVFICSLIYKRAILGFSILGLLILMTISITFGVSFYYDLDGVLQYTTELINNSLQQKIFSAVYIQTYTRGGAFFIGMLTGYLIFKWKKNSAPQLPTKSVLMYTSLSLIILFSNVIFVCVIFQLSYPYNVIIGSLYVAVSRTLWGVGMAILIVVLGFGDIPIIGTFLHWPVFVPLGKLSLNAYLVHYLFVQHFIASQKTVIDLSPFYFVSSIWAITVWSFMIALVAFYTVEAPIKIIVDHFMKTQRHSKHNTYLQTKLPNQSKNKGIGNVGYSNSTTF